MYNAFEMNEMTRTLDSRVFLSKLMKLMNANRLMSVCVGSVLSRLFAAVVELEMCMCRTEWTKCV